VPGLERPWDPDSVLVPAPLSPPGRGRVSGPARVSDRPLKSASEPHHPR